ncbi:MAG: glycosyl transferase family 1 [Candidatus Woesearchaeota archaeon]|nr:MAG: glycosyl transferase family 1 [Candidatus Woesearchaeota archaeon]
MGDIQKRKVLIATDNFLPRWDGISRFLSEIIPRLSEKYDITVIAPDFGTYEDPNIKLIKIPVFKFLKIGDFNIPKFKSKRINDVVKNSDIVFSQTIGPIGALAIKASKRYHKPIVSFIHSIEWELVPKAMKSNFLKKYSKIITKRVAKRLYNKCDLLIMPSQNVVELFIWNNIRTRNKVVNLGVNVDKFKPADEFTRIEKREKIGIGDKDIVIGYHGRISREKDLITLLRAFTRIQNNYDDVKLLIVGEGLKEIKEQLSSRKNVILTGPKNDPVPYLQVMDIYCITSLTETTCLSLLEAMSCEVAPISTEVGFIKSYIKNNFNGLFFQKQNPYHLSKQIEYLIKNPDIRRKIAKNARATVIERFSWDNTAKGIIDAIESTIELFESKKN